MPLIRDLLEPVGVEADIEFVHALTGAPGRLRYAKLELPSSKLLAIGPDSGARLPIDTRLLASFEGPGVPTLRSMILGDRVLRERSENEALGYATHVAIRLCDILNELRPDIVLASFDSLHSSLSLAICKVRGIPWVAMAFTVIPQHLTGFCKGVTPDTLVPLTSSAQLSSVELAETTLNAVRERQHRVLAFRPPASLAQNTKQFLGYCRNFCRRIVSSQKIGADRYSFPTFSERLYDILRRRINASIMPRGQWLPAPPAERFVFFPLQMTPESSIDTWAPFYRNQLELVKQLSLAIPLDVLFIVKLHFSDPDNYTRLQIDELLSIPGVRIAHPSAPGMRFLESASLVVAIQGTASLEAALLGKPVVLFGASPYVDFPRTERAAMPEHLHAQIVRLLSSAPASHDEIVAAFAAYIRRYMPGRINDWGRAIEPQELKRLAQCFDALKGFTSCDSNRRDWYKGYPFI